MPTIHCPSCGRALSIPEHQVGVVAACPLCGHTFETAPDEPPPALPPMPPVRVHVESREPAWPAAPLRGREIDADKVGDRAERLKSAARWLLAAAWVAGLQSCCCTCIDLSVLGLIDDLDDASPLLVGAMLGRFIVVGILVGCAGTMSKGKARAWIASVLGIGLGLLHFVLSILALIDVHSRLADPWSYDNRVEVAIAVVSHLLATVVLVGGVFGGIKTIRALSTRDEPS